MTLESRLKNTHRHRVGQSVIKSSLFTGMLFQTACPTFFGGLPNNNHPEAGQLKKNYRSCCLILYVRKGLKKQCQSARHILT